MQGSYNNSKMASGQAWRRCHGPVVLGHLCQRPTPTPSSGRDGAEAPTPLGIRVRQCPHCAPPCSHLTWTLPRLRRSNLPGDTPEVSRGNVPRGKGGEQITRASLLFCHNLYSMQCGIRVLGLQGKLRSRPAGRKGV